MSAETSSSTPETTPSSIPAEVGMDVIEEMRQQQIDRRERLIDANGVRGQEGTDRYNQVIEAANAENDDIIQVALMNKGVFEGDDHYDEYAAALRSASIDHVSPDAWADVDENGLTGRDAVSHDVAARFGVDLPESSTPEKSTGDTADDNKKAELPEELRIKELELLRADFDGRRSSLLAMNMGKEDVVDRLMVDELKKIVEYYLAGNMILEGDPQFDEYRDILVDAVKALDGDPESDEYEEKKKKVEEGIAEKLGLKTDVEDEEDEEKSSIAVVSTSDPADDGEADMDDDDTEDDSAAALTSDADDDDESESTPAPDPALLPLVPAPSTGDTAVMPTSHAEIDRAIADDPEMQRLNTLIDGDDGLRSRLAKLSAKRQGKMWNRKNGSLGKEYAEVEAAYNEAVTARVKRRLQIEKEHGVVRDDAGVRFKAATELAKEFKDLQHLTIEELAGTKVSKVVVWMTEGGTAKRIFKGVLVGAGVGAVAGIITVFTAGTGAVAMGTAMATGAVGVSRFSRGYAAMDNRAGSKRGMSEIESAEGYRADLIRDETAEADEAVDTLQGKIRDKFEDDTKKEQRKRKISTGVGMIAVAAGAAASAYLIPAAVDAGKDLFGNGGGGSTANALPGGGAQNPEGPKSPIGPGQGGDKLPGSTPTPERVYGADALRIDRGEGLFQTYQDLGIPQKDWSELLAKSGPELQNVKLPDGSSLSYRMPNGEWGIRMTPDGKFPQAGLDKIMDIHDKMTGVSTAPAAEAAGDFSPAPSPVSHDSIASVMDKSTISAGDISGNTTLMEIAHVNTAMSPDVLGRELGIPAGDWLKVQDYIAAETAKGNATYTSAFRLNNGYLQFTTNRIPAGTMADILNHAPRGRYGLGGVN